jgi:hypothetical protein
MSNDTNYFEAAAAKWVDYVLSHYEDKIEAARYRHEEDIKTEVPREDYIPAVAGELFVLVLGQFERMLDRYDECDCFEDTLDECINGALEDFPEATDAAEVTNV